MVELLKSIGSFSWAAGLYGVQQLVNLLPPAHPSKTKAANYILTTTILEQFNAYPLFVGIEELGGEAARATADLVFDVLQLKPLDPRWLRRRSEQLIRGPLDAAVAITPGENL